MRWEMRGTRTVQNGHPEGVRDVQWGVVFRFAAWGAAILAVVLSGVAVAGINRLFEMSTKIEVIEYRTAQIPTLAAAIADIQKDVSHRVEDAEKLHSTFLTKDEFDRLMQPEVKKRKR